MSLLARFSLANRGLVALIAVVTTAFGAFAVPSLKQQLLPSLEFPAAFIVAAYPGAAPEIVESQVTEPIENSLQGIPGLEKVTSTSREGVGHRPGAVRVRHRPRRRGQQDADRAEPDRRPAARRASTRRSSPAAPTTCPAVVLAATGGGDEQALAEKLRHTVRAGAGGHRRRPRRSTVTGTRDQVVLITPEPGEAGRGRARRRPRSPRRCRPTASPCRPARSTDGEPVAAGPGRHADSATVDDLRGIVLRRPRRRGPGPARRRGDRSSSSSPRPPRSPGPTASPASASRSPPRPDGNAVAISHEIRDRLADLQAGLGGAELTVGLRPGPVRREVHREPDHRGPARPGDGGRWSSWSSCSRSAPRWSPRSPSRCRCWSR